MEDLARQLLERLEEEWAPAALELGSNITRINGAQNIVGGVVLAALAFVCYLLARKCYALKVRDGRYSDWELGMIIAIIGTVLFSLPALAILFNIWNWIALFDPKLALANQILNSLLK